MHEVEQCRGDFISGCPESDRDGQEWRGHSLSKQCQFAVSGKHGW